jgi:hypothetical protein
VNSVTGSTPRSCPAASPPAVPLPHPAAPAPAGHCAHPPAPWNRSRRRPAHGQHTHRRTRRPVTARTWPAGPRFAGTPRRQDPETSLVEGMARTRCPSDPRTPASDPGQADQAGIAGGCQKNWDPADRSFRRTTRAASAESVVRPGPRLLTLRPNHLKTGEAGPEARNHILPPEPPQTGEAGRKL